MWFVYDIFFLHENSVSVILIVQLSTELNCIRSMAFDTGYASF